MKKINILTIRDKEKYSILTQYKKFGVYLGNGQKRSFASKKEAKIYLVQVNSGLNAALFALVELRGQLFEAYNRCWFYFDQDIRAEKDILQGFEVVTSCLAFVVDRSAWPNGNYFVFQKLSQAIGGLASVVVTLEEVQKARNNWAELRYLQNIARRLVQLRDDIFRL